MADKDNPKQNTSFYAEFLTKVTFTLMYHVWLNGSLCLAVWSALLFFESKFQRRILFLVNLLISLALFILNVIYIQPIYNCCCRRLDVHKQSVATIIYCSQWPFSTQRSNYVHFLQKKTLMLSALRIWAHLFGFSHQNDITGTEFGQHWKSKSKNRIARRFGV